VTDRLWEISDLVALLEQILIRPDHIRLRRSSSDTPER
jgi:hypothetical protein